MAIFCFSLSQTFCFYPVQPSGVFLRQELPYHLEQLLDNNRLTRCLLEWEVFQRLFSEDFSIDLLRSWQKVRKLNLTARLLILSEPMQQQSISPQSPRNSMVRACERSFWKVWIRFLSGDSDLPFFSPVTY